MISTAAKADASTWMPCAGLLTWASGLLYRAAVSKSIYCEIVRFHKDLGASTFNTGSFVSGGSNETWH